MAVSSPPAKVCSAPWDGAVVHVSGEVYPCTMLCHRSCGESLRLGNLHHNSLEAILDGPAAMAVRDRLIRADIGSLCCAHCDRAFTCNLYGDPVEAHPEVPANWSARSNDIFRLELAITDRCNLRCRMCALARGDATPKGLAPGGQMPLEVVRASIRGAVALAGEAPVQVWLHWLGEPLLHPQFLEVVRIIAASGPDVRLFLVTNGAALTPALSRSLLDLPCRLTLSVSLNAWTRPTYRAIHGPDLLDRVVKNVRFYVAHKQRAGKREEWPVIVTAVVLAENLDEIPDFVHGWRAYFESTGCPASISLNGRPTTSHHQVMLLCEVDQPESPALFRTAIRRTGLTAPDLGLHETSAIDALLTWAALRPHQEPPLEHLDPAPIMRPSILAGSGPVLAREVPAIVKALIDAGHNDLARRLILERLAGTAAQARQGLPSPSFQASDDPHDAGVDLAFWSAFDAAVERGDHATLQALAGAAQGQIAQDACFWLLLGSARAASGDPEAAREAFTQCLASTRNACAAVRADARRGLSNLRTHLGGGHAAPAHSRTAPGKTAPGDGNLEKRADPQPATVGQKANETRQGRASSPEITDRSTREEARAHVEQQWLQAKASLDAGDYRAAREALDTCLPSLRPWHQDLELDIRHALARLCLELEEAPTALEHAERAVALAPQDAYSHRLRAEAEATLHYQRGRPTGARRAIGTFLEDDRFDADQRAQSLYRAHCHGDVSGAIELSDRFLRYHPGHPFALWIRGANRLLRDDSRASEDLEASARIAEEASADYLDAILDSLAELALRRGDPRRSAALAERALAIRPDRAQTAALLARARKACAGGLEDEVENH